jgi:hypothetical protein
MKEDHVRNILERRFGKTPLRYRVLARLEIWWDRFLWKVFGYDRYQ